MGISELLAAKNKELLEARFEERRNLQSAFPDRSLLWAALGPTWTATLARLAGFPTGGKDVAQLLEEIAAQGFTAKVSAVPELVPDAHGKLRLTTGEDLYTAGEQSIREIVESTPDLAEREAKTRECLKKICEGLRNAQQSGSVLPDRIEKWLELAEQVNNHQSVKDALLSRVDECLSHNDEIGAVAWVEAAFPLEKALTSDMGFGADVALGVKLAGLRVQLMQRRAVNERFLQPFLERDQQLKAFRDLLSESGDQWALHFAGAGGVGKTMLVRYLESRAAPAAGAATARVDFDYVSPEYPTTKPALLLVQFASELRLADKTGNAALYFQSFFDKAKTLHERLGGQTGVIGMAPVDEPEFQSLLEMIANAIRQIPGRVVLILDTCEELAKMRADGSPQDAVEVTFKVLGQLHEKVPSLRVVMCGRRPLASEGAGWKCLRDIDRKGLPKRTYLRLHEIRSFTAEEARQYLIEREQCRADLVKPILPHCREKGYAPLFSNSSTGAEERYSPFDLALYATWAKSEPNVTPEVVASTTLNQYVRTRIVDRIVNAELKSLIPAITWLGLVDGRAMAALAGLEADSARVRELASEMEKQEWVSAAPSGGCLVPPDMRRRLLDYFAKHDAPSYDAGRSAAAAFLEQFPADRRVVDLDVVHLEAALEALQPEPERAARWWQGIDDRIQTEGAWDWVLAPTLRLLADEHWPESVCEGKHIRAAIAATRAAALVQTENIPGALEAARIMEADAAHYPDEEHAADFRLIAKALRCDAEQDGTMTTEIAAAAITGTDWILVQPQSVDKKQAEDCIQLLRKLDKSGASLEQQAYGQILRGRILAVYREIDAEDPSNEKLHFQSAFGLSARLALEPTKPSWRFWKPPQDLASRVRLEFLRWAWPNHAGSSRLTWWLEAPERIDGPDSDRLAAAVLAIRAADRCPTRESNFDRLLSSSREVFDSYPRLKPVHRHFPPYFTLAAEEMAYTGSVAEALDLLGQQAMASESAASDFESTLEVDAPLTRVKSRFRLMDEGHSPSETLEFSGDLKSRASVWALRALGGDPAEFRPDDLESLAQIHARWSTCIACDPQAAQRLLEWAKAAFANLPDAPETFDEISCRLDLLEANALAERFGLPVLNRRSGLSRKVKRPATVDADFEIALRIWSLGIDRAPSEGLVQRIGVRRASWIALEIGELLALRVPQAAMKMLRFARRGFRQSGDSIRAWMASVCLALTFARAGRKEELNGEVKLLKSLFERQRNDLINPDSWKAVEAAASDPGAYPGMEVLPSLHRPWLLRTAMSLALSRDGGVDGEHCANVRQVWLRISRTLPPEGVVPLPHAPQEATESHPLTPPVLDSFRDQILTIQCLDQAGRMAPGMRMRLTVGSTSTEILTPAPTDPYNVPVALDQTHLEQVSLCVVDRNSAWVCWEAILDAAGSRMFSRRTHDANLPVPNLLDWHDPTYHTLTIHHAGADLGGSAFGKTGRWRHSSEPEQVMEARGSLKDVQVLHVVTDVVDTTGGVRLSFQSERGEQRGKVIRAEELTKLLPDMRLYVLQLPVGLRNGKRDGVCREKASLLRAFAAQLQLASRQIVITLPGLRFREGQAVLEAIVKGVEAPQPTAAKSIFGELTKARAHLLETLPPDETEAAFDICYFG